MHIVLRSLTIRKHMLLISGLGLHITQGPPFLLYATVLAAKYTLVGLMLRSKLSSDWILTSFPVCAQIVRLLMEAGADASVLNRYG